jgi:serine/threonine protein kinase
MVRKPRVLATAFNEYTVIENIGNGGSGSVFSVSDADGKQFALKIIDPSKTSTQKLKRFQNEIAFCQKNTHPHIISVFDHGRSVEEEPFYVMPLYHTTLEKRIVGTLPPDSVLKVFAQLLDGVEAAHLQRVTHRDLKPQNVLGDSRKGTFVIADFGIAHFEEEDLRKAVETKDNERLANFQYAAPEQRTRGREVTYRADIYALGLILNEMFTKEVPQGTGFKTINSVQPNYAYLDALVDQMVRQDPGQRPDISEVKKQLIARQNEFLSLQKIDQLTKQVVPDHIVDDPLVRDPIKILGVDYQDGVLAVKLSSVPTQKWISEFQNQHSFRSFHGYGPERTEFMGGPTAYIRAPQNQEQQQMDYFKSWLANVNAQYKQRLEEEAETRRRQQREQLRQMRLDEEKRQAVLKNIQF